jgi:branched-chain amino acid transport system permease protein
LSKAAPWAIYGVLLIGLMYLMPTGAMGLLKGAWARWRPAAASDPDGSSPSPSASPSPSPSPTLTTRRQSL